MPYDYVNFSCVISNSPGLYATLTECENAVNDGTAKAVLRLSPLWNASKRSSLPLTTSKLGDGYQQTIFQGLGQINEEWDITSPVMSESQVNQLLNQLRRLSASSFFLWSPNNVIPYQQFTCDEWRKIRVGVNQFQINSKFKMTILGSGLLIQATPTPTPPPTENLLYSLPSANLNGAQSIAVSTSIFNTLTNRVWTIETYINQSTQAGEKVIFTSYNFPQQAGTLILSTQRIGYAPSSTGFSYSLPQNQNIHWAVSRNSAGLIFLHLNGIYQNSVNYNPTATAPNNYIGGSPGDNNLGSWFLAAALTNFRIFGTDKYQIGVNFVPPTS